jgi:uncharacterized protein
MARSASPETHSMNTCGSCTLCCKLTEVPELQKPVNMWCLHCTIGYGCNGYEGRPQSCRSFQCVWLSDGLDAELRPDRSRIIFEKLEQKKIVLVLQDRQDAWMKKNVKDAIDGFLAAGYSVAVNGRPMHLIPAKGKTAEDLLQDIRSAISERRSINGSTGIRN